MADLVKGDFVNENGSNGRSRWESSIQFNQLPQDHHKSLSFRQLLQSQSKRNRKSKRNGKSKSKYAIKDNWSKFRTPDGSRILSGMMTQRAGICLAIAFVRHVTCLLKIKGLMPSNESLSIRELIQLSMRYLPDQGFPPMLNYVTNYRGLGWVLQHYGLVLDSFNPLTYDFEEPMPHNPEVEPPLRYKIGGMEQVDCFGYSTDEFENMLREDLKDSPIACVLKAYPSYFTTHGNNLYEPADTEIRLKRSHAMLLVGSGKDRRSGKPFLKFQDCNGGNIGRRGFIRVAAGKDLIYHYFRFTV